MGEILNQAKNLGKLVLDESIFQSAEFSKGKKVLAVIKEGRPYCHAMMNSWAESDKLKPYLSENQIDLLFIEKGLSLELAQKMKNDGYPTVKPYLNGRIVGWEFTLRNADDFIEWLKEIYN